MYKKFLLFIFTMIAGFFAASAQSVVIDVDNAKNVRVYTYQKGDITLTDGMNRFTDLTSDVSPLVIEPANGATIKKVTKNNTDEISPSGDGLYRIGIEGSMMIKIETEGNGGGEVTTEVGLTLSAMGNPGSFTAKAGDLDVTIGSEMKVASGTEVTVYPATGYAIEKVADLFGTTVGQANADGTYTFAVGTEPSNWYYVYTKVTGLSFTIEPDYAPNVAVYLDAKPNGKKQPVTLNANGTTTVVTSADMQPVLFEATEGAEIVGVTRNGEEVPYLEGGQSGMAGYMSSFTEGDAFVVTTKGRLIDFTFVAPEGNAPLESYVFSLADGTVLSLSGMEQKVQLPLGAKVYIKPLPGTDYRYVLSTSTANDMKEWVRALADDQAKIYGTRSTQVTLNVDNAARVSVKQSNGRGDALTLTDGENKFDFSTLRNSLAITPTEGNLIMSVKLDGNAIEPNRNGVYLVTVAEGSYVDVESRKIPGDVAVSFVLNEGASLSWLTATADGQPFQLAPSITLKSGSAITVAPALGYRIDALTTSTPGCNVVKDSETGIYTLTVGELADAATFSVVVNEITAEEGNALVVIKTSSPYLTFLDRNPDGTTEKKLTLDQVNEVKIGNNVYFSTYTSGVYIKYVKVNGTDYPEARDKRFFSVTITGNSTIEVETYQKVDVTTVNTMDTIAHVTCGRLYIVGPDGNNVQNLECEVGQTLTFKVETTVGYKFAGIEKFYPEPVVNVEGYTYTITEDDADMGMIQFHGVFVKDEENPSYTVRTKGIYETLDGMPNSQVGYVYIYTGEGEPTEPNEHWVTDYTAAVGEKVRLVCLCHKDFTLVSYCLSDGYPNSIFPGVYYTVSADDANAEGTIWITGIVEPKGSGIEGIVADGSLSYDRSSSTLVSATTTHIYSTSGAAVLTAEAGSTDLSALPAGVYIAVAADGKTLKFVK